ncbi:hypothetical protein [Burkholderia cepacia]|uniref:hypothetical protein n=1 Tax=Burkholderia cepacia TaxID=292 RepID=UPI0012D90A3B|nr:hypothetical protein [Burkholderia cepacia]
MVVFYADDHSEHFTSWERFNTHAAADSSPVESVLIKYNFLIAPPKIETPQAYTISIRIASRVTVIRKLNRDTFFFGPMPKIVREIGNRTAEARIKYVDYVIARSMLHTIDEWTKTLPRATEPAAFKWLERRTAIIPPIFRNFMAVIAVWGAFAAIPHVFTDGASLSKLSYFLLASFSGVFVSYGVGHYVGRAVEQGIDKYNALSFLELTSGDTAAIDAAKKANKSSLIVSIGGIIGAFMLSTASRFATGLLLHWFTGR